jgi:hypothetical protein
MSTFGGRGPRTGRSPGRLGADAVSGAVVEPTELLDADVDQLTGSLALVALRGLEPKPAELAHPAGPVRIPETVESAIQSDSAISASVNRNRLSAAISSARRSCVRLATTVGSEQRSRSPADPWQR